MPRRPTRSKPTRREFTTVSDSLVAAARRRGTFREARRPDQLKEGRVSDLVILGLAGIDQGIPRAPWMRESIK